MFDLRHKLTNLFQPRSYYCDKLWASVTIRWNGDVEPCPCAFDEFPVQNAFEKPISKIWNSPPYTQTRRFLNGLMAAQIPEPDPEVFPICTNCAVSLIDRYTIIRWRAKGLTVGLLGKAHLSRNKIWRTKFENYIHLLRHLKTPCETIPFMPLMANIDVANICNLRCPFCLVGSGDLTHPRGLMSIEAYTKLLKDLGPTLLYLELYRYGEPLLNPALPEMIKLASTEYSISTRISTNLSFKLTPDYIEQLVFSGLDDLVVAADGTTQAVYEQYRRDGKLELVLSNIRALVKLKKEFKCKKPRLIWQFLIFHHNIHQLPELHRLARKIGIDKVITINPQIPQYDDSSQWSSNLGSRNQRDEQRQTQILSASMKPAVVAPLGEFLLESQVINTTNEAWAPDGEHPSRLGVKLYSEDRREFFYELGRGELPRILQPGEKANVVAKLTAPKEPGTYWLKLDMLREWLYWYEWRTGNRSKPFWLKIKVSS